MTDKNDANQLIELHRAIAVPETNTDFPPQEVWWRYRVLAAGGEGDDAWQALDRARQLTLDGIATLSDEGLRRNYLNEVTVNRDVVQEWTRQAVRRGVSLAPFLERETSPGSWCRLTVGESASRARRTRGQRSPSSCRRGRGSLFGCTCKAKRTRSFHSA